MMSALLLSATLQSGEIAWRTGFRETTREARFAGRPILLYFTADW